MHNFVFHNPVKVIFGRDSLLQTGSEARLLAEDILLVYGQGSIHKNGVYSKVIESLAGHDLKITEHPGVQANPYLSHVKRGIEKAHKYNCKLIIGVGGGSVIDTAKAISAGMTVNHDVWKFFIGKKSIKSTVPVITIPTMAGSGSEMNNGMVLTHDEKQLKLGFGHRKLHPIVCIADPTATFSVPADQSAFGAVDILVHCLESYFTASYPHPPFQFRLLENICRTVVENIPIVLQSPNSYEARSNMLWCASMALSGLAVAGLGRIAFPMHLIEHGISALFDIPHGAGLSAILPGWVLYHKDTLSTQLSEFGVNVFSSKDQPHESSPDKTVNSLITFIKSLNIPTCLSDIGISESDYGAITSHCLSQAKIWRFKDYNEELLYKILKSCQTTPSF